MAARRWSGFRPSFSVGSCHRLGCGDRGRGRNGQLVPGSSDSTLARALPVGTHRSTPGRCRGDVDQAEDRPFELAAETGLADGGAHVAPPKRGGRRRSHRLVDPGSVIAPQVDDLESNVASSNQQVDPGQAFHSRGAIDGPNGEKLAVLGWAPGLKTKTSSTAICCPTATVTGLPRVAVAVAATLGALLLPEESTRVTCAEGFHPKVAGPRFLTMKPIAHEPGGPPTE